MATGDSGDEAYTAIAWGVGLSHERSDIAGAEGFHSLEGNMCGTAMRGADALPGSKATSRAKGSHRKLGDLGSGHRCRVGAEYDGPHREDEESKPMMHGHEKSDLAIVAGKSANNVAPRCGAIRGVSRSGVGRTKYRSAAVSSVVEVWYYFLSKTREVPGSEPALVHHAPRRRGGVAARGARAGAEPSVENRCSRE